MKGSQIQTKWNRDSNSEGVTQETWTSPEFILPESESQ